MSANLADRQDISLETVTKEPARLPPATGRIASAMSSKTARHRPINAIREIIRPSLFIFGTCPEFISSSRVKRSN